MIRFWFEILFGAAIAMLLLIIGFVVFSSCNTIVITHTQGRAEDVVDSTASAQADINPKIDVPLNLKQ